VGDIILAVDGTPVESVDALIDVLEQYKIGDRVQLSVFRAGKVEAVYAVLGSSGSRSRGGARRSLFPQTGTQPTGTSATIAALMQ
jgi:PDZ domain-containing secreted protein